MTAVCVLGRNVSSVQDLNAEEGGGSEHLPRKSSAIGHGFGTRWRTITINKNNFTYINVLHIKDAPRKRKA